MPLTTIDDVAAIVVIDMQKGIVAMPTVHPGAEIAERIGRLLPVFRAKQMPVVLVNVAGRAPGRTEPSPPFTPPPDW
ncbi:MAG TPA: isochorismatase family protein, partial [Candidatus Elarobacter sp.]